MHQTLAAAAPDAPEWLVPQREMARRAWDATSLPTRKTEQWKYTSIAALEHDFGSGRPVELSAASVAPLLPELDALRLVFVNGHFAPSLSSGELPAGLSVVRFADADAAQAARIREHLGSALPESGHPFATLNGAALGDGLFLDVEPGVSVAKPVQVAWLTADQGGPFTVNPRLLVLAGDNSCLSLVEHYADTGGDAPSFSNAVSELLLAPGATVNHYRLNLEQGRALHIGGVHARLERDATLTGFYLGLGADLKRIDLVATMAAPGAHAELDGVYLPRGDEHIDYHTTIEHAQPHCSSLETFRGVIGDRARAVFNGRIHIHPQAQKTRAELSNKNLLTSAEAEVNTKPELEIYADDVQCAHGATVAQLDDLALHYLRSRGVSRAEAEVMLSFGFVNEVLESARLEALRDHLRPLLAGRFARDPSLMRHLA
jgi:Fe-S cluster assembly protein SufD